MNNHLSKFSRALAWSLSASLILGVGLGILPKEAFASYTYQQIITLNLASKNPASQSNFTVLVATSTDASLKTVGNGGHVQNANGYDIVFSSTACTSPTLMNWEMENYNASSGAMTAWVLETSLSTSNQLVYMCYGNSGISTFQGGSTGSAWNANFKDVYHFGNASYSNGSTITDSTSRTNTMTIGNYGTSATVNSATGQIANGLNMAGSNQYNGNYASSTSSSGIGTGNNTINIWVNYNSVFSWDGGLTSVFGRSPNAGYPYNDESIIANYVNSTTATFEAEMYANGGQVFTSASSNISSGTWNMVTEVYDGSYINLYLNGAYVTRAAISNPLSVDSILYITNNPTVGSRASSAIWDEAEVSNTNLSANWITTEYNNQSSPSSFETFGSESGTGGGGGSTPKPQLIQFNYLDKEKTIKPVLT